jgi:ABC-2 type transport system permease protein
VLVILFGSQIGLVAKKYPMVSSGRAGSELIFPGLLAYLLLILVAPAYNCFAYEGRGMQTLFTAPVRFRDVFVGKNLMLLAVITFELLLSIGILALRIGLPSLPMLAATMAALLFSVAGQIIIANWSSLNFPRKLDFGTMRNQRASGMAVLLAFGTQIVVAGACSVVFLSGRWFGNPWLPAGVFAVLAASALGGYFSSLDALSELAEKKREVLLNALCK